MTTSAFGIDHGDISKAMPGMRMPGSFGASKAVKSFMKPRVQRAGQMGQGFRAGLGGAKPGVYNPSNAGQQAAKTSYNTGMRAGGAVRANAKPAGIGAGIGVAGGGAGAYGMNRRKQPGQR